MENELAGDQQMPSNDEKLGKTVKIVIIVLVIVLIIVVTVCVVAGVLHANDKI